MTAAVAVAQVLDLDHRVLSGRIGQQQEGVEEGAGRAFAEEPARRRRRHRRGGVAEREHLPGAAAIHRALDGNRLRRGDLGRHVGRLESRKAVDVDRRPALRRQVVGPHHRGSPRQEEADGGRRRGRLRVLQQVEQLEARGRRALGEEPGRSRAPLEVSAWLPYGTRCASPHDISRSTTTGRSLSTRRRTRRAELMRPGIDDDAAGPARSRCSAAPSRHHRG